MIHWFIKIVKEGSKTRFRIQQGKSDADINQQPKDGYETKEEAKIAKARMVKQGTKFTFRNDLRKKK